MKFPVQKNSSEVYKADEDSVETDSLHGGPCLTGSP